MSETSPAWFEQAVNTPFTSHTINVDGCDIAYQQWSDDKSKPGLLLIHGNGAHAGWWDFVAPSLLDRFHVAALNFSGMGDSGHRQRYTPDNFVSEVIAVCDAVGFKDNPLLLGHSFGGRLAFHTMKANPDKIAGVIMADSPFHNEKHMQRFKHRRSEAKANRIYDTFESALERFRLSPAQPCDNDYILKYIGARSIKQTEGGWTWKFDPRVWAEFDYKGFMAVKPVKGDKVLALIYGENSILFEDGNLDYNRELFKSLDLPDLICLPNTYHHLLLDRPLEFIELINRTLNNYLAK